LSCDAQGAARRRHGGNGLRATPRQSRDTVSIGSDVAAVMRSKWRS